MSQQVEELIAKIKTDGIKAAEEKAEKIIEDAEQRRSAVLQEAHQEAKQIIGNAKAESQRLHDATEMALRQSSRDMLLNLRQEIENMLKPLISAKVQAALTPEQLAGLIRTMVDGYAARGDGGTAEVSLNEKDVKPIADGFLSELQNKLKGGVTLSPADDIAAGFTISFDQGKSSFDFSQESLVEYLGGYVNDYVAAVMKASAKDAA